jgi:hypothetical protein
MNPDTPTNKPNMSSGAPSLIFIPFVLVFLLIAGVVIFGIIKSVRQSAKNDQQPVLTVPAKLVTKRLDSTPSRSHERMNQTNRNFTLYYVTFRVHSGDRMEFQIASEEYGLLAEGDEGQLTFQGTRYKGFQRTNAPVQSISESRPTALAGKEIYCPYCGLGVASEFKFCPKCGKALPEFVEEK